VSEPVDGGGVPEQDAAAVAAVAAGDADALEALYSRYGRLTYSVAYRITGDPSAAEECTQDAFLALWRRAGSFDPSRARVSTWLFTVARNQAITRLRGRTRREQLEERVEAPGSGESVEELVAAAERAERLAEAIAELPTPQLEAVQLAYFAGLSQNEIAERLGVPLGTVKGRIRLALERLRGRLADDLASMEAT
jgi:RNA polymerase sigma-70 factor (ECF subfamily)